MKSIKYDKIDKDILEKRKIGLEIEKLDRPWYKNSITIFGLLPSLFALVSILYGFYSGFFDIERSKLELQRYFLKKEINEFNDEKNHLKYTLDSLKAILISYKVVSDSNSGLLNKIALLNGKINNLQLLLEQNKKNKESSTIILNQDRNDIDSSQVLMWKIEIIENIRNQYHSMIDENNPNVIEIQKYLTDLGYYIGSENGIGEQTKKAIREFKQAKTLGDDCLLDKKTIVEIYTCHFFLKEK